MPVESVLNQILTLGQGGTFYSFTNADGKQWIMPEKNIRTAMCLYQPSGIKGKMMKALFPIFCHIGGIRQIIHAKTIRCTLQKDLHEILCQSFGVDQLEFSIFCGTPCAHQKITIQLSLGHHIFGYCKVSDNKKVSALFVNESRILSRLTRQGIKHIPYCVYQKGENNRISLFVQSTEKTIHSQMIHNWSNLQDGFLYTLFQATKKNILFEKSDFYQTLMNLRKDLNYFTPKNRRIIEKVLNKILKKNENRTVEYSAYHADFTPWNMLIESGYLFVFDWEDAKTSYPPFLDHYHFFTMTAVVVYHWNIKQFIIYIKKHKDSWINLYDYQCYLLHFIAHRIMMQKENLHDGFFKEINIWLSILKYISKNEENT